MFNRINISDLARVMAEGVNQAILTDLAVLVTEEKPLSQKTTYRMPADNSAQQLAGVAI